MLDADYFYSFTLIIFLVVSKPSRIAESRKPILNETTICDYLLNSCDNGTLIIDNTETEPIRSNQTSKSNIVLTQLENEHS